MPFVILAELLSLGRIVAFFGSVTHRRQFGPGEELELTLWHTQLSRTGPGKARR
jgi:hypothetical protein